MRAERLIDVCAVPVEWLDRIDSSNGELLRRAETLPDRYVLLADQQSAGRGRRGRAWVSPPGANLYLSIFARLPRPLAEWGGLSLAIGIAVAEALQAQGARAVQLKWPNDLVVGADKLGGILVEIAPGAAAVIGLGLNLAMPAEAAAAIDQPWTDLRRLGLASDVETQAGRLLPALLAAVDAFAGAGFAPFRSRWAALDALREQEVRIVGGERAGGRVLGIGADGALRLLDAQGEWLCRAGEVSVRRA